MIETTKGMLHLEMKKIKNYPRIVEGKKRRFEEKSLIIN